MSSTQIVITWDTVAPIDQNGVITMYQVLYQPLQTFGGAIGSQMVNVSGTEMSVLVADAEEYTNYTISVRPFTIVGEGPYSEGTIALTVEDGK